jgi:hypothetical protein
MQRRVRLELAKENHTKWEMLIVVLEIHAFQRKVHLGCCLLAMTPFANLGFTDAVKKCYSD